MQKIYMPVLQYLKSAIKDGINSGKAEMPESVGVLKNSRAVSIIGSNMTLDGKMVSDEDMIIYGQVSGAVIAKMSNVTVGLGGQLTTDIFANRINIEGSVIGDIVGGEKVTIGKTGHVVGSIQAPMVTLEDGAKFKGCIEMDPEILDIGEPQQSAVLQPLDKTTNGQQTV